MKSKDASAKKKQQFNDIFALRIDTFQDYFSNFSFVFLNPNNFFQFEF